MSPGRLTSNTIRPVSWRLRSEHGGKCLPPIRPHLPKLMHRRYRVCDAFVCFSSEVSKTGDEVCALSDEDKTTTKGIANTMKSLKAAHSWSQRPTPFSVVAPLHAQLINDFINIICIFFTFSFSIFRVLQFIVISIIVYYMHLGILYHNTQQEKFSLSLPPSRTPSNTRYIDIIVVLELKALMVGSQITDL